MIRHPHWFWYFIAAIFAALPIIFIKKYIHDKNKMWIVLSIISYLTLIYSYIIIFTNNQNITVIYPLIKVISILLVVLVGIFFFHNKINITKLIGILFGIISVYILAK